MFQFILVFFEWFRSQFQKLPTTGQSLTLFMGVPGTRKQQTFRKIWGFKYLQLPPFKRAQLAPLQQVVCCPSMNFEQIDEREQFIEEFQKFYKTQQYQLNPIKCIAIFVKFERTDIMKKNIQEVYKYIQEFKKSIIIVVTDFQYSDNEYQDRISLVDKFKIFFQGCDQPEKQILFIKSTDNDQLVQQNFQQATTYLERFGQPFTTQGTIFQEISDEEYKAAQQGFLCKFDR